MKINSIFIAVPWGGTAITDHFKRLGTELAKVGYHVIFLVPGRMNSIVSPDTNPSIFTWPSVRPTKLKDALFLNKMINEYRPVCLISNFAADNIMALTGWIQQVPVRVIWHHTLLKQIREDGMELHKMNYLIMRKSLVLKTATDLVPVSYAALRELHSSFRVSEAKCSVFYNALLDPLLETEKTLAPNSIPRLACVGRMSRSKGQDVLIRAISLLANKYPNLLVDFIGDGDMKESYMQLANQLGVIGNCNFVGRVNHADVLAYMNSAWATIVPSRDEAFGLVNIESMSVGVPVIASNVGGIPEVVTDGIDGLLFPPGDAHALAERINLLFENSIFRNNLGKNARKTFLERFEDTRAVQEQIKWLEERIAAATR